MVISKTGILTGDDVFDCHAEASGSSYSGRSLNKFGMTKLTHLVFCNQLVTVERSSSCKCRCIGALPKANQRLM